MNTPRSGGRSFYCSPTVIFLFLIICASLFWLFQSPIPVSNKSIARETELKREIHVVQGDRNATVRISSHSSQQYHVHSDADQRQQDKDSYTSPVQPIKEEGSPLGTPVQQDPAQSALENEEGIPIIPEDATVSTKFTENTTEEPPTFQKRLKIGKRFAFKVANYRFKQQAQKFLRQKNITLHRLGQSEWFVHNGLVERALQSPEGCLVYSFGVADQDVYTEQMAQRGCQVFAMDPTVNHPQHWMPGVTFYPWGLANRATATTSNDNSPKTSTSHHQQNWSHPIYGTITGSFYTLPEIIRRLDHDDGRTITAVKFDCEGCEFAAFEDLVVSNQQISNKILMMDTEFHYASTLGMVDANDVARMYYAHAYLKQNDCQLIRQRRHAGFEQDQDKVPQLLVDAGVAPHSCCYEMAYICHKAWID